MPLSTGIGSRFPLKYSPEIIIASSAGPLQDARGIPAANRTAAPAIYWNGTILVKETFICNDIMRHIAIRLGSPRAPACRGGRWRPASAATFGLRIHVGVPKSACCCGGCLVWLRPAGASRKPGPLPSRSAPKAARMPAGFRLIPVSRTVRPPGPSPGVAGAGEDAGTGRVRKLPAGRCAPPAPPAPVADRTPADRIAARRPVPAPPTPAVTPAASRIPAIPAGPVAPRAAARPLPAAIPVARIVGPAVPPVPLPAGPGAALATFPRWFPAMVA